LEVAGVRTLASLFSLCCKKPFGKYYIIHLLWDYNSVVCTKVTTAITIVTTAITTVVCVTQCD
jgi:hypothetical protein